MTAATRTNNNGKRKPYADLVCGKALARERLKGNLKSYFETKGFNYKNYFSVRQITLLLEQVWVQSDNQGRSIIRQQTGKRTYTTTINQIAQNLEIVAFKSFALAGVLLEVPHTVYVPNKGRWLKNGTVLYRNTWRKPDIISMVEDLSWGMNDRNESSHRPKDWADLMYRLFMPKLMSRTLSSINRGEDIDVEAFKEDYLNRELFICQFELWLAYACFSNDCPNWAPLLRGVQGTGKGTLADVVLSEFLGEDNVVKILPYAIKGAHGNQVVVDKRLVIFDEVLDKSANFMNVLKNLITEPDLSVNPKHLAPYTADTSHSTLLFTNEEMPMAYSETERRFLVSPWMEHEEDEEDTAAFLWHSFVPWMNNNNQKGRKELGAYLKFLVNEFDLPSTAYKTPWFYETCYYNKKADQKDTFREWLDNNETGQSGRKVCFRLDLLSESLGVPSAILSQVLKEKGYNRKKGKPYGRTSETNAWVPQGTTISKCELSSRCDPLTEMENHSKSNRF